MTSFSDSHSSSQSLFQCFGSIDTPKKVFISAAKHADQPLKDALDLFYLTGQRIADTLRMDERDIRDDRLAVQQGKNPSKKAD